MAQEIDIPTTYTLDDAVPSLGDVIAAMVDTGHGELRLEIGAFVKAPDPEAGDPGTFVCTVVGIPHWMDGNAVKRWMPLPPEMMPIQKIESTT